MWEPTAAHGEFQGGRIVNDEPVLPGQGGAITPRPRRRLIEASQPGRSGFDLSVGQGGGVRRYVRDTSRNALGCFGRRH